MCSTEINNKGISTVKRYLYLNTYAFLLLAIGGGIMFIDFWLVSFPILIIPLILALVFIKGGVSIISTWEDKKRKYSILMERNRNGFRHDTFKEFMTAPCGRLLVKIALKDLGETKRYKELAQYRHPIKEEIRKCLKPQTTKIIIHQAKTNHERPKS